MTQIMARASALICAIFLFRDATPFVPAAVRTAAHKTKTTTAAARSVITPPVFPTSTTTANTRTCEINRREGWYHVATRSRSKCSFAHPSPSVGDSSGGGGNKMATKPPLKTMVTSGIANGQYIYRNGITAVCTGTTWVTVTCTSGNRSKARKVPRTRKGVDATRERVLQVGEVDQQAKVIRGRAGPADATPVYDDTRLLDRVLLNLFRSKLAEEVGGDVFAPGYDGLMEMIRVLNEKFPTKRETQQASRRVLKSLFPSWLPASFAVMFSKPFPAFSSRLNAWVTLIASQWLMGPSQLNDVEIDDGSVGTEHGLLVERCRFLEASGCASVCMNTCKVPTEEFFAKDMGLNLEMTPNYEDFSCQFSFNKTPLSRDVDEVFRVACFEQCPSRGALRQGKPVARCHQIDLEKS